ncbi:hypothetical protein C0995_008923 [Termitomyces sp. Mi166|nr:hypothetical protein C0995_008923 [Termitomyces sp. Mi166\
MSNTSIPPQPNSAVSAVEADFQRLALEDNKKSPDGGLVSGPSTLAWLSSGSSALSSLTTLAVSWATWLSGPTDLGALT